MQIIIIDGNNFSDINGFYDEIQNKFSNNLGWDFGCNLNAFNDVLRGGFGVYDDPSDVIIHWVNAAKSKKDLGAMYDRIIEVIEKHEDGIKYEIFE